MIYYNMINIIIALNSKDTFHLIEMVESVECSTKLGFQLSDWI